MTPRAYRKRVRHETEEAARDRIVEAALDLLRSGNSDEDFSVDAIARRAGVARMTIYNQFGSKAKLLDAVFAALAEAGGMGRWPEVFRLKDPLKALDAAVALFGEFYAKGRRAHERLIAAAAHDRELREAIAARNERRRAVLRELVRRLRGRRRTTLADCEAIDAAHVFLSAPSWVAIAGPERTPADIIPLMQRATRALLGADGRVAARKRAAAG